MKEKKTAINIYPNPIKWRKKISPPKKTTDKIILLNGLKLVNTHVVLAGIFETPWMRQIKAMTVTTKPKYTIKPSSVMDTSLISN